jgi:Mrp family chromosome partitioning ATPase
VAEDPIELLSSRRCRDILALFALEADVVLLDGPPVLEMSDAVVLSQVPDAVIMVVATKVTTRQSTDRAKDLLEQAQAPLVGNILSLSRGS